MATIDQIIKVQTNRNNSYTDVLRVLKSGTALSEINPRIVESVDGTKIHINHLDTGEGANKVVLGGTGAAAVLRGNTAVTSFPADLARENSGLDNVVLRGNTDAGSFPPALAREGTVGTDHILRHDDIGTATGQLLTADNISELASNAFPDSLGGNDVHVATAIDADDATPTVAGVIDSDFREGDLALLAEGTSTAPEVVLCTAPSTGGSTRGVAIETNAAGGGTLYATAQTASTAAMIGTTTNAGLVTLSLHRVAANGNELPYNGGFLNAEGTRLATGAIFSVLYSTGAEHIYEANAFDRGSAFLGARLNARLLQILSGGDVPALTESSRTTEGIFEATYAADTASQWSRLAADSTTAGLALVREGTNAGEVVRRGSGIDLALRSSDIDISKAPDLFTKNSDGTLIVNNPRQIQLQDVHDYATTELRNAATNVVWHRGDIAIITGDTNGGTYLYTGADQTASGATVDTNWTSLATSGSGVTSIGPRTGAVSAALLNGVVGSATLTMARDSDIILGGGGSGSMTLNGNLEGTANVISSQNNKLDIRAAFGTIDIGGNPELGGTTTTTIGTTDASRAVTIRGSVVPVNPLFTDSNTEYTFAVGTAANTFSVTPTGGTAQTLSLVSDVPENIVQGNSYGSVALRNASTDIAWTKGDIAVSSIAGEFSSFGNFTVTLTENDGGATTAQFTTSTLSPLFVVGETYSLNADGSAPFEVILNTVSGTSQVVDYSFTAGAVPSITTVATTFYRRADSTTVYSYVGTDQTTAAVSVDDDWIVLTSGGNVQAESYDTVALRNATVDVAWTKGDISVVDVISSIGTVTISNLGTNSGGGSFLVSTGDASKFVVGREYSTNADGSNPFVIDAATTGTLISWVGSAQTGLVAGAVQFYDVEGSARVFSYIGLDQTTPAVTVNSDWIELSVGAASGTTDTYTSHIMSVTPTSTVSTRTIAPTDGATAWATDAQDMLVYLGGMKLVPFKTGRAAANYDFTVSGGNIVLEDKTSITDVGTALLEVVLHS